MKCFNKTLVCSLISASMIGANAVAAPIQCLERIGQDTDSFLNPLASRLYGATLDQSFVDSNKTDLFRLFATNIKQHCNWREFNDIADSDSVKVAFRLNDKKYDITINTERLFDYVDMQTAFLVANDINKNPGSILTDSDKPQENFYSSDCSDYYVFGNLDDDAPVNKAGQAAFASYGGKDEEFFLDWGTKHGCKAFPGIVLTDTGGWLSNAGKMVVYTNYKTARNAFKTFASQLNDTKCGHQGLAVYHVATSIKDLTKNASNCEIKRLEILSEPEIIR